MSGNERRRRRNWKFRPTARPTGEQTRGELQPADLHFCESAGDGRVAFASVLNEPTTPYLELTLRADLTVGAWPSAACIGILAAVQDATGSCSEVVAHTRLKALATYMDSYRATERPTSPAESVFHVLAESVVTPGVSIAQIEIDGNQYMMACKSLAEMALRVHNQVFPSRWVRSLGQMTVGLAPDDIQDLDALTRSAERVFRKTLRDFSAVRMTSDGKAEELDVGRMGPLRARLGREFCMFYTDSYALRQRDSLQIFREGGDPRDGGRSIYPRLLEGEVVLYDSMTGARKPILDEADLLTEFLSRVERHGLDIEVEKARIMAEYGHGVVTP